MIRDLLIAAAIASLVAGYFITKAIQEQWEIECNEKYGKGNWVWLPSRVAGLSIAYECVPIEQAREFCEQRCSELLREWCFEELRIQLGQTKE